MEELKEAEIIVGYGVQWDSGIDNLVKYRDMSYSLNSSTYEHSSILHESYAWLVKLVVF